MKIYLRGLFDILVKPQGRPDIRSIGACGSVDTVGLVSFSSVLDHGSTHNLGQAQPLARKVVLEKLVF
jgi:hypothetical protein